jgi:hypothetical protein
MRDFCIKHEHSRMSFKNNVLYVWIFKILNVYKYYTYYDNMEFIWFLYKPMKPSKFVISDWTKLVGKEPTLRLFGQFLFTKISLSRLFVYKQDLLKFVTWIPTKEKIFYVSMWNLTSPRFGGQERQL